jgi:GTP-binding protein Era
MITAREGQRCGFVGVIGAPNAGKSTLVNRLVGAKVSIVSPKVQTTRTRVMGIVNKDDVQLIFVDTPGIFAPKRRLEKAMVAAAWAGAKDAEEVLLIVDARGGKINAESRAIIDRLKQTERKVSLVMNKIDMVEKEKLLGLAASLHAEGIFTDIYMISALTGDGVDKMMADLAVKMPEGPWARINCPTCRRAYSQLKSRGKRFFCSWATSCLMTPRWRRKTGKTSTTAA